MTPPFTGFCLALLNEDFGPSSYSFLSVGPGLRITDNPDMENVSENDRHIADETHMTARAV
jgi:hypothetical protein